MASDVARGVRLTEDRRPPGGAATTVGLAAVLIVVGAMTVLRAVPYDGTTPIAQVVAFTPWVAGPATALFAATAALRRRRLALVAAVCALTQVVWIAPFFTPGSAAAPSRAADGLRVMSVNALYGRADAAAIVRAARAEQVDVLAVQELTGALRARLRAAGLDDLLPHQIEAEVGTGAAGSGLWADRDLADPELVRGVAFGMPSAVLEVAGTPIRVTVVHTVPPSPGNVSRWRAEMSELRRRAGAEPTPQILLGDFNATYDHATFRTLLDGRFRDAARTAGRGLGFTWRYDNRGMAVVAIDHILIDRGAGVRDVATFTVPGSDHRGIVATVLRPT